MPTINETLVTRRGHILPNTKVSALEVGGADTATTFSDKYGNFELTVVNVVTAYDLWIGEIETVGSGNYIGRRVSSGSATLSFTLATDATWKTEHFGDDAYAGHPIGSHKTINADNVSVRSAGYIKELGTFMEFRISDDSTKLQVIDDGTTFFFQPFPEAGASNRHMGLREAYDDTTPTNFYFGAAKTRYINSTGDFNLNTGSFASATSYAGIATFNESAVFANDNVSIYPQLETPYDDPQNDEHLTPKGYVDAEIAAATGTPPDKIIQDDTNVEVVDTGVGQINVKIDGVQRGVWTGGKFGFGNVAAFTPVDTMHLRENDAQTAFRAERTGGSSPSTAIYAENRAGTITSNTFYLMANNTNAMAVDTSQNIGIGVFSGLAEKLHLLGNMHLEGYLNFALKNTPANPGAEEARLYIRTDPLDANNNQLCVKMKQDGAIAEVVIA